MCPTFRMTVSAGQWEKTSSSVLLFLKEGFVAKDA